MTGPIRVARLAGWPHMDRSHGSVEASQSAPVGGPDGRIDLGVAGIGSWLEVRP